MPLGDTPGGPGRVRLIRPHHWAPQPWPNGRGVTHEVWRDPLDGAVAMRLSLATLVPGPFSTLPGVQRVFVALGHGVTLDGVPAPVGEPVVFAGEAAPRCQLTGGPATALNLMVRQGWVVRMGECVGDTSFAFALGGCDVADGRRLEPQETLVGRGPLALSGEAIRGSVWHPARGPVPPPRGLVQAFESAIVDLAEPLSETAWIVTAHNPRGELLPQGENAQRQAALERRLVGYRWLPAVGRDAGGTWSEPSSAVLGCGRSAALALAAEFGQDAIYELQPSGERLTLWC